MLALSGKSSLVGNCGARFGSFYVHSHGYLCLTEYFCHLRLFICLVFDSSYWRHCGSIE